MGIDLNGMFMMFCLQKLTGNELKRNFYELKRNVY